MEWNRRVAVEKDLEKEKSALAHQNMVFDESGNFLIFPCPIGIKVARCTFESGFQVYNVATAKTARVLGTDEALRFTGISLCRALPDPRDRLQGAATTVETEAAENPITTKTYDPDPLLVSSWFLLFA